LGTDPQAPFHYSPSPLTTETKGRKHTQETLSLSLSLSLSTGEQKDFCFQETQIDGRVETNFFNQPTPAIPKTHPLMQTKKNARRRRRRRRRVVIVKRAPIHIRYTHNLETQNSET